MKAQRQKEKGIDIIVSGAWKYTPRASWAELDARFAKEEELKIAETRQTRIDAWET